MPQVVHAIARGIAEAHGGTLTLGTPSVAPEADPAANTTAPTGAIFHFRVPAGDSATPLP